MKTLLGLGAAPVMLLAAPAAAQTMDHSNMPGMTMPAKPAQAERASEPAQEPPSPEPAQESAPTPAAPDCPSEHAAMGHCTPKPATDPHAGHTMPDAGQAAPAMEMSGTALPAGDAPAPPPPTDHYADRQFSPQEMAEARRQMMFEQGGQPFYQVMFNLAEYQAREGTDGFRWEGEGWFGGDINRLVVKTEGSGAFGEGVEDAEIQALYSRAIGPLRRRARPAPALRDRARVCALCRRIMGQEARRHGRLRSSGERRPVIHQSRGRDQDLVLNRTRRRGRARTVRQASRR